MNIVDWEPEFRKLLETAVQGYQEGQRAPERLLSPEQTHFLASIGCTVQEIADFAEDICRYGEPHRDTIVKVTALRRNYFLSEQAGQLSTPISASALPAKTDTLGGIAWLPRIIAKAKAKLRGELPKEVMYGCSGDRGFLKPYGMGLDEFLRLVWQEEGQGQRILRDLNLRLPR